jgi:hypothetical protein
MKYVPFFFVLALAGCPKSKPHIHCDTNEQCTAPGHAGVCITNACAVVDHTCGSGYRFDTTAGESGDCVPADTGVDLAMPHDASVDAAPVDMAQAPSDLTMFKSVVWTPVTNPAGNAGTALNGVSGSGPNDIWAVGDKTTILHYTGATWATFTDPGNLFAPDIFTFVAAGPAAGEAFVFDGSFELMHIPATGNPTKEFLQPKTSVVNLFGAFLNGSDLWAVGPNDGIIHSTALASPSMASGVDSITPPTPRAVHGASGSDVWVVGDAGMIIHVTGSGSTWTGTQLKGITTANLSTVWVSATDIWAGGPRGALVHLVSSGGQWSSVPVTLPSSGGSPMNIYGIWGSSASDVWIVGDSATNLLHWAADGTGLQPAAAGTTNILRGIWGSGAHDIWAVGDKGTIIHGQ